jgi:hypothetical protein
VKEVEYPDVDVTCVCGEKFKMWWNGGELDQHDCKCGRKYYGEHKETVMVILEPGEKRTDWD